MFSETIIVGRVGNAPELRYTPSGDAVTGLSVAVNKTWKDKAGETQQQTTWVRCTAWRKTAEVVAQYVTKGMQVLVSGEIQAPRVYTDKSGNPAASLELTINTIKFLGSKSDNAGGQVGPSSLDEVEAVPF